MCDAGGGGLEFADGVGGSALGVALEEFAAGLHEHDDKPCEWLSQYDRGDDREHRNDVGGEVAAQQAAHGAQHHGGAEQDERGGEEARGPGIERGHEVHDAAEQERGEREGGPPRVGKLERKRPVALNGHGALEGRRCWRRHINASRQRRGSLRGPRSSGS